MTAARRRWTIATARQHLPELVDLAAREPQRVYRRDRLVAAVVSPELVERVEALLRPTLAAKLAELQRLCAEDDHELVVPDRVDRPNPFVARQTRSAARRRSRRR